MNIHPLQAVGFLPDPHSTHTPSIILDSNLTNLQTQTDDLSNPFPTDPLKEETLSTSFTSNSSMSRGNFLEPVSHSDQDVLHNMIARCLDNDVNVVRDTMQLVSADELPQFIIPREELSQALLEEMDLMLAPACPPPENDQDNQKEPSSWNEATRRKKRGIQKAKRSRAPARPWTEMEHQRFEESLELFGRDWEQCAAYIGTRRAQLVRSHAQKHLIKLWKLGKPLPKKVAESGTGYTLSGKPLLADSASARSYLTKIPCPNNCEKTK